jgi:hypothetical protein
MLGFNEDTFWRCSPRKLLALLEVHKRINGIEAEEEKAVFIDQVL